jgi:hypothetical protein
MTLWAHQGAGVAKSPRALCCGACCYEPSQNKKHHHARPTNHGGSMSGCWSDQCALLKIYRAVIVMVEDAARGVSAHAQRLTT